MEMLQDKRKEAKTEAEATAVVKQMVRTIKSSMDKYARELAEKEKRFERNQILKQIRIRKISEGYNQIEMNERKRKFFEGFEDHMRHMNALAMIRSSHLKNKIRNRAKNNRQDLQNYMNLLGG